MNATAISISVSIVATMVAIIGLLRLYSKDGKGATQDLTRIETKVDYVGSDVKEMRDDIKAQGLFNSQVAERLVKVEESTKSAHHRIDALEKGE